MQAQEQEGQNEFIGLSEEWYNKLTAMPFVS